MSLLGVQWLLYWFGFDPGGQVVQHNVGVLLLGHVEVHVGDLMVVGPLDLEHESLVVCAGFGVEDFDDVKLGWHN